MQDWANVINKEVFFYGLSLTGNCFFFSVLSLTVDMCLFSALTSDLTLVCRIASPHFLLEVSERHPLDNKNINTFKLIFSKLMKDK